MRFELTKEFLEEFRQAIVDQNNSWIIEHIHELHFADIADLLDQLTNDEARYVYFQLTNEHQAEDLMDLDEEDR